MAKKESDMEDNKHPHHDLIVEWAKDTSKEIQLDLFGDWRDCHIESVTNDEVGEVEFRVKPREFVKGHWYPCVDADGDNCVYVYNGVGFKIVDGKGVAAYEAGRMRFIGKSLGEIKFS